jgi:HSP20 family molecular chaperone IbpA
MNFIFRHAVLLLGATCLAQAYYIRAHKPRASSPAEEFQARHNRWVADIENLKKQMTPQQQQEQEGILGKAFEEWFQAKVSVSGIRSEIKSTDSQVIVSFKIPGLRTETLKIVINDVLIRASYSARSFIEDVEAVRQFETVMPIPVDADSRRHRFVPEGDGFKLIFEKRDDPSLKS